MTDRELRPRKENISYVEHPQEKTFTSSPDHNTSKPPKPPLKPKSIAITKNHSVAKTAPKMKAPPKPVKPQHLLPNPPFFAPLHHQYPLHRAYNTLPPAIAALEIVEPIHIFRLIMNDQLFELMATNTNKYAEKKREGHAISGPGVTSGRKWEPIEASELRAWMGIIIYMGICRLPAVKDYWRHDGIWPTHHFCSYMSQNRFEQIRRYFHISPPHIPPENNTSSGRRLWHHKVDPILDQLRQASQQYRMPSSNISCDEAMIRCTGRSADTYKMKNKPIPKGVKFHVAADHGYVFDFHPTSNKSGPDPFDEPSDFSNTSSVVLQLVKRLPYRIKSFNVYMDNYYTNLPLFSELRKLGIGACGTARTTSKDFPAAVTVPKNTTLDYHHKAGVVERDVAVLVWIDNGPVSMMTTIHRLKGRNSEVARMRKKPGPKSTNAAAIKKAQVFSDDEWRKEMMIPSCIDDYNHHMGGIDVADQLRSYYDTQLVSFQTWYPIFFWALDTTLTNSFLIWRDIKSAGQHSWSHKDFRMYVAWELIMSSQNRNAERSAKKRVMEEEEEPPLLPTRSTKTFYLTKYRDLPKPSLSGKHLPVHLGARKDCIMCRWKQKQEGVEISGDMPKSVWKCMSCSVPLCLNEKRNCYSEYHESSNF